jgi:SAM-dependent methyltransferase
MAHPSDKSWEQIYSERKKFNSYPYDILVSIVARNFFHIPIQDRNAIRALDLGCAAGNNAKFLAENGFNESIIRICKERFAQWNLKGSFVQGDFVKLPYEDSFFDSAVDRESIYANRISDIEAIVQEVHRTLKKGGLLVSFMYSTFHPDIPFSIEVEPNTYGNFTAGAFKDAGIAHFTFKEELLRLYKDFEIDYIAPHAMNIVHKQKDAMGFDEYIVVARKK